MQERQVYESEVYVCTLPLHCILEKTAELELGKGKKHYVPAPQVQEFTY